MDEPKNGSSTALSGLHTLVVYSYHSAVGVPTYVGVLGALCRRDIGAGISHSQCRCLIALSALSVLSALVFVLSVLLAQCSEYCISAIIVLFNVRSALVAHIVVGVTGYLLVISTYIIV